MRAEGEKIVESSDVIRLTTSSDRPLAEMQENITILSTPDPPVSASARRGLAVIEGVLFISLALALIVAGLVFYYNAT